MEQIEDSYHAICMLCGKHVTNDTFYSIVEENVIEGNLQDEQEVMSNICKECYPKILVGIDQIGQRHGKDQNH